MDVERPTPTSGRERALEIRVLGPVEVLVHGEPVPVTSPTQRMVLAILASVPGQVVATERLIDLIWDDDPPADARGSLKSHVSRLRRTLADATGADRDIVAGSSAGYALQVRPEQVDAHELGRLVRAEASLDEIELALSLCRGEPFGELGTTGRLAGEAARLRELRVRALEMRARHLIERGRSADAVADLQRVVAEEELREPAWILLVTALDRAGRNPDAVRAASRYRDLVREVGLEVSSDFEDAERALHDPGRPEAGGAGPAAPPPTGALPVRVTSLVGRDDELARTVAALADRRVVTLTGPGGVGKTSLALEVARASAGELPDGVFVVALGELGDDDEVDATVARTVGAPTTEPIRAALTGHLASRRALLVLDNCEHVRAGVADLITGVLTSTEGVRVLATSRHPIGVAGEQVVTVEPLARDDATELFVERAADAGAPVPDELRDVAARICDHLDGLPLPIEMAAARVRALGLRTLEERLDERLGLLVARPVAGSPTGSDEGRRTLRETIAWSHDLLTSDRRDLFEQLAVFAGSFDVATVEAVCRAPDIVGAIADLVDHSLVVASAADDGRYRYRLLETIRAFAGERLEASGRGPEVVGRHIAHHTGLAELIGAGLRGPDEGRWAARFDRELPDIRAAHARALERGDVDRAATICASLYPLVYQRLRADVGAWAEACLELMVVSDHPRRVEVETVVALNAVNRGELDEAGPRLARLLELPETPAHRLTHEVMADLATYRGDLGAALHHAREVARVARVAGDRFTEAFSLVAQALALGYDGRTDEAVALVRGGDGSEPVALRHEIPLLDAWFDYVVGEVLAPREPDRSLALLEDVVVRAEEAGWALLAGVATLTASSIRARRADPEEALPAFADIIGHWRRLDDWTHQRTTLRNLAVALGRCGRHEPAVLLLGATGDRESFGDEADQVRATTEAARRVLGDGRVDALVAEGGRLDHAEAVDTGLAAIASVT